MILLIASSTAAREPGMTRITDLADQAAEGPAQDAGGADLGITEHAEQLAVARQRPGEEGRDGLISPVARADAGAARDRIACRSSREPVGGAGVILSGSSGTITRSRIRCPAASAIATIKAPEVSVSIVRVSETVITASFKRTGSIRPMLIRLDSCKNLPDLRRRLSPAISTNRAEEPTAIA